MTPEIRTAADAIAYIHSNTWTRHAPGLERMRELCRRLGDPQKSLRFLHVAGTNGKGSVCAMLDAASVMLSAMGRMRAVISASSASGIGCPFRRMRSLNETR